MNRVLIIGGGIAGMSTAIVLARRGFAVEIVESDPQWKVYGAGITITGPTYRAIDALGLLDDFRQYAYGARGGTRICSAGGDILSEVPIASLGPELPPIGGIMRPKLHELLSKHTLGAGVQVRLGITQTHWEQSDNAVRVWFSDGAKAEYSVVVVADGAYSKTRSILFAGTPEPRYTGQYCWRLVADRPPEIDRAYIYLGGQVFAGLVPTSESAMYLWLLETRADKSRREDDSPHRRLADLMSPFRGLLSTLRDGLNADSAINCRPLDAILMPKPWYRGRIILIGDAAHSTTPHLASGAGIAMEDALVLGQLLCEEASVDSAFSRFMRLRWERCKDVVESSVAIGALQQSGASPLAFGAMIGAADQRLRADIWHAG